ncbi:hypothetical protein JRO89_XS05G0089900 [Xanthoceras sorbifolium]|uniref:Uncharacterized protein n=1 Tax=Xanthoceras sorbifolium TaxID=99658 RepID=A0ABQ8I1B0_9ROSI|nr:hypothetical protein JRO89_XS05G0089900 [Xanthoceras sorbifolium]
MNNLRFSMVSNELGAGHPRSALFSMVVAVISGFLMGLVFSLILMITRDHVEPVLSGVAVGAGWQRVVAYVNLACYYILGIPLGLILAFKFDLGTKMIYKTNWNTEVSVVEDRIMRWGGDTKS